MRSPTPFDTHAYVRKLVAAGVPELQAEVHASALTEVLGQLATKDDLHSQIELLRQEFKATTEALRQEFRIELKELELRIAERLRSQMLWFFAVQFALFGIAIAVVKFVP